MELRENKGYVGGLLSTTAVLFVLAAAGAAAQPPADEPSPRDRALDLFMQAERAYEEGDVERSLALLVEARTIHPESVLLYNMARAYETLGRPDEALSAYRSFLEEEPDTEDRGAIQTRIAALESQIAEREQNAAERERLEGERAAAEARANQVVEVSSPSPVPWIVAGTGLAAVGAGAVFGLLATSARSDAEADPVHLNSLETFARGEDFAVVANVLFVAGGAVAVVGVVWGIVDLASSGAEDSAASRPSPAAF